MNYFRWYIQYLYSRFDKLAAPASAMPLVCEFPEYVFYSRLGSQWRFLLDAQTGCNLISTFKSYSPYLPCQTVRKDLTAIPEYSFPDYIQKRIFVPGDEKLWVDIQTISDRYNSFDLQRFCKEFANDFQSLAERQYYLFTKKNRAVGTATAWYADNKKDGDCGLVHWVAILPEFQGKGLGKALMTLLLKRMRKLGHTWAKVNTNTIRIPAINLYLKFGFVPVIRDSSERKVWQKLKEKLPIAKQDFQTEKRLFQ